MNFTVKNIFDDSRGKFSVIFGNTAIIDCNYFFLQIVNSINNPYDPKTIDIRDKIAKYLISQDLTLCDYSYNLNGVLKDQELYYLSDYKSIKSGIYRQADVIVDHVTTQANMTIETPLVSQFKQTSRVETYL